MHPLEQRFARRHEIVRIGADDAIGLLRPGQAVAVQVALPASHLADLLGHAQPGLALAQRRLGALLLRQVAHDGGQVRDLAGSIAMRHDQLRHRLVRAVGTDHLGLAYPHALGQGGGHAHVVDQPARPGRVELADAHAMPEALLGPARAPVAMPHSCSRCCPPGRTMPPGRWPPREPPAPAASRPPSAAGPARRRRAPRTR